MSLDKNEVLFRMLGGMYHNIEIERKAKYLTEVIKVSLPERSYKIGDLVQLVLWQFPDFNEDNSVNKNSQLHTDAVYGLDKGRGDWLHTALYGTITDIDPKGGPDGSDIIRVWTIKLDEIRCYNFHPAELNLTIAIENRKDLDVLTEIFGKEKATQLLDKGKAVVTSTSSSRRQRSKHTGKLWMPEEVFDKKQINKQLNKLEMADKKQNVQAEFEKVEIQRRGDKIILPEGMNYDTAHVWLDKTEKAEETLMNFQYKMKGYALDGAYALYRALENIYGFVDLVATPGFFGPTPPAMVGVKLPDGSIKQVPWGRMMIPAFDKECYLSTAFDSNTMEFVVHGQIRRKHEFEVTRISKMTEKFLKEESIYKGQAIRVDLGFMSNNGQQPSDPEFMTADVLKITEEDVLMSDASKLNYSAVLLRIEQSEACIKHGIPLKHGCLLGGPYGTGKTLTAKLTAAKAVKNGWTFIYLENAKDLKHALRLAEVYTPAVIFAED